jgi:hypothetical protein
MNKLKNLPRSRHQLSSARFRLNRPSRRFAPLGVAMGAIVSLVALASATTPASAQAVNFGSINVCPSGKTTPAPCSANQTLTFSIPAGTTISSIPIVTTGLLDLDFKAKTDDTSSSLCKAQTYTSATTCTVDVTFAPLAPGTRNGAVELLDASGALVATTYIYGVGVGPQIAFSPPAGVFLGNNNSLLESGGIALDAAGNIFLAPSRSHSIQEVVAAGGYTTIKPIGEVTKPVAVAIDGAGNLFVIADNGATVEEILAAGGYTTVTTLLTGQQFLFTLSVDSTGNVFYVDSNDIKEILAAGGYTTVNTVGTFNGPGGVAIDSAGNLFITDEGTMVKEIMAAGGYTTVKTLTTGLVGAVSIAVDAAENLFVNLEDSPDGGSPVVEISAAGDYTNVSKNLSPYGDVDYAALALDGSGNIFLANYAFTNVVELSRSQPPAFAFGDAIVGTQSTSSQSATAQNVGNAALTGSGLSLIDDSNFKLVAGPGTPPDCTAGFSLAPSSECNISTDFTPQSAGTLTGSVVLTDNSGNVTGATQSIALSGVGVAPMLKLSPTTLQFGLIVYGASATKPLTVTNDGSSTVTIDPSSNGRGTTITGNTCGAGLAAGKSCTLQVNFKPVHLGPDANTLTIGTNIGASPTVFVSGTATGVGSIDTVLDFGTIKGRGNTATLPLTVTNYGVPGAVTVATSTGATTFHVISNGCTAGITSGSSCTIEVEFAPIQTITQTSYLELIPSTGPPQWIEMEGALVP